MDIRHALKELIVRRPWTTVFYSYRGGVGRTTLAIQTALNLVDQGKNVCLMDFDVDAPGLGAYRFLDPPTSDYPGLLNFLSLDHEKPQPPLTDFVYQVHRGPARMRQNELGFSDPPRGKLWVVRAGQPCKSKAAFLRAFDWNQFYRGREHGALVLENLRCGLTAELGCEHLIIDAKTGLSEVAGVCTGHLADAVAIVYRPDYFDVQGLRQVVQQIRNRETREGRNIARIYVGSLVRCEEGGEVNPSQDANVNLLAEECENSAVPSLRDVFNGDARSDSIQFQPTYTFIPRRDGLQDVELADQRLVRFPRLSGEGPDRWGDLAPAPHEIYYKLIKEWVEQAADIGVAEAWADNRTVPLRKLEQEFGHLKGEEAILKRWKRFLIDEGIPIRLANILASAYPWDLPEGTKQLLRSRIIDRP